MRWHMRVVKRGTNNKVTIWQHHNHCGTLILTHEEWNELKPLMFNLSGLSVVVIDEQKGERDENL
jgi:hypothetical protein